MASTNAPRPWRSLGALGLLLVMMYGTMALLGEWTPRLGLDLRGGTSITLSATTPDGSDPTPESMRQAVDIVRARVNGSGVAEAEITTQGSTNIVVQVPGVGEDAQLAALVAADQDAAVELGNDVNRGACRDRIRNSGSGQP